ncbi:MAG TPA: hypothetical protein VFN78_13405 [Ktedonobacterales bacterium]|nr:hypothetical protein [Ktedonobacterales bacterium]
MSRHNPDPSDELDNELRGLFARATAHVDPPHDLAANVQRHAAESGSARSASFHRPPSIIATLGAVLVVALLAVVLVTLGKGLRPTGGTGAAAPTATSTAASAPFTVTSVDLAVTPASVASAICGSSATFTYTATFHLPARTAGGVIQFAYTLNNGRSQTPDSVTVGAGQTSAVATFTSSGVLSADHTYPGPALIMVTSPNSVISPSALPSGACVAQSAPGPFQVTSVSMTVNPTSVAGLHCGTATTVTYTALFHLAPNGPGGTIQFDYTVNNGRGSTPASVTVAPGQTTASYSFTWSGALPADHTYPEPGGVSVRSPNTITSPLVGPSGACS